MLEVKVTNQEKYNQVSGVDFSGASRSIFRGSFDGNVFIQLENGQEFDITGQHGVNDWKDDYGFTVIEVSE